MSLYNFKGTNRHRRLMQKTFFKNIDVSIPWGDAKFFGGANPTFAVTRKLLKVDGQVWCQTMQNS